MAGPIRVLIVEDHPVVAEGLTLAIERHPDLSVVGVAGSASDAVQMATRERPQVVLMDYYLPDDTGAEATRAIRRKLPGTAVVSLSGDPAEDVLLDSVEAGACGFLLKTQPTVQLVDAVRRAAQGEMLIPADVLAGLVRRQRERARQEVERERLLRVLTEREREVLGLMVQGLDNRGIATQLVISYTTARSHVQSILAKLGAHSKLEAAAMAREYGLLTS
ncbi:MAG: response regulator [Chloroflexota bacterium]